MISRLNISTALSKMALIRHIANKAIIDGKKVLIVVQHKSVIDPNYCDVIGIEGVRVLSASYLRTNMEEESISSDVIIYDDVRKSLDFIKLLRDKICAELFLAKRIYTINSMVL